ncbi:MAG: hypothetical protein WEB57_11685 [Pseudohongiellaceae bacterium]
MLILSIRTALLPLAVAGLLTATAAGQGDNWAQYAQIRQGEAEPGETGTATMPLSQASAAELTQAVVYSRVPRTRGQYEVAFRDGTPYTLQSPDVWDTLPDTRNVFEGFNAPGQLILREPDGSERILYDCFNSPVPCVPLDPMVSFDGSKVLFSVYRGERLASARTDGITLPNQQLATPTEAQLHVVDIESGTVTPLAHNSGVFDVSPAWLPDGRLIFASTRAGTEEPLLARITPNNRNGEPQLYISEPDGTDAVNITPHEVTTAMHPYILQSGRVAYSSQWLSHNLAYGSTNGGINWPGTLDNMWLIMDMDIRGGDMNALLGAHRNSITASNGRRKTMKALHFLGQRHNGDICAANYYRANNLGLGDVFCWAPEPVGVEGALPDFLPRDVYNVADWSKSNDETSFQENGIFLGKIGYPEGLENNQLLLTTGRGACLKRAGYVRSFQETIAGQPEKRACDVGLYATTRIPSTSMADLALVVDHEDWHEFGARVVTGRQVATPPLSQTTDGSCQLASSDAGTAETSPSRPYEFNNNYTTSANNGGEIDGLDHDELAGIRFWEVVPHTTRERTFKNSIGHRLRVLGDVKLLEDDSFKVKLPCDTPYVMTGIDDQGRVIKRDQVPQSLRPGEKRLCTGCHLHSREGRPYETSMASRVPAVNLLGSRPVPSYEEDIKPIFEARCQQCHSNDYVPLMDYDQLVWDFFQEALPEEQRIQVSTSENPRRRFGLHRPYTSKFVNSMFARESLLYWKAANERTDGRSDSTYDNDIDFGPDHPTGMSDKELEILAEWLDSGATSRP